MGYKFNPFTNNLDITGSGSGSSTDNFSYKLIDVAETKTIPINQQMLVDGHVSVLGHLSVLGELVDISGRVIENSFYTTILDVVVVSLNRLLLYKNHLTVIGHLRVFGQVSET